MSDAPDRIWADVQVYHAGYVMGEWDEVPLDGVQEWVRADLYQSQAERIAELEGVLEKVRSEAGEVTIFYPSDLALLQETVNGVLKISVVDNV
jgi:hypothetical protein